MEAYGHHYNLLYRYDGPIKVQTQHIDYTPSDDEDEDEFVSGGRESQRPFPVAPIAYENCCPNGAQHNPGQYLNMNYYGSQLVVPKVTYSTYYQVFKKPVPLRCTTRYATTAALSSAGSGGGGGGARTESSSSMRAGAAASVTVCTIKCGAPIECVREEFCFQSLPRVPNIYKSYRCAARRRPRRPKLLAEYVEVLDSSRPKKCWLYRCMSPDGVYECLAARKRARQHHRPHQHQQQRRSSVVYKHHDSDYNGAAPSTCAASSHAGSSSSAVSMSSKCPSSLFSSSHSSGGGGGGHAPPRWKLPAETAATAPASSEGLARDHYSSITSLCNHNHRAEYLDKAGNDRSLSGSKQDHRRSRTSKGFRLCADDAEPGSRRNR